jgi:hypothetical protein
VRRLLRDLAVGLLLAVLVLGAVELGLRAAGVGAPGAQSDLSRGFDPRAAYLVPDPEQPGGWTTQFGDKQMPERRVPPRDGRARVLLFGGSNTNSLPVDVLRRALGEQGYDVHNLGRNGYGSARVRPLVEQSLEHLDPDVSRRRALLPSLQRARRRVRRSPRLAAAPAGGLARRA